MYEIGQWNYKANSGYALEKMPRQIRTPTLSGGGVIMIQFHRRICTKHQWVNTFRPTQNGHHFPDDSFKRIFLNENVGISINISLKFVPKGPINNILALVQIMAWRRLGDKPLSEPIVLNLLTHICVTRPQWVEFGIVFSGNYDVNKYFWSPFH